MTQHVSHRASDLIAMTDIVERLRRLPPSPIAFGDSEADKRNRAEREEAADEIERLKRRLNEVCDLLDKADDNIVKQEQEIERLRIEVEQWRENDRMQREILTGAVP